MYSRPEDGQCGPESVSVGGLAVRYGARVEPGWSGCSSCPGITGTMGSKRLFARVVGRQVRDGVDVDPGDGPVANQPDRSGGSGGRGRQADSRTVECLSGEKLERDSDAVGRAEQSNGEWMDVQRMDISNDG